MKLQSYVLVALLMSSGSTQLYASEDLGLVSVESSTIDVKADTQTEVSNTDVIDAEMMQTVDPKNLVDVLKTVPGVTSVARAGEMMQIRFRGVGQQQYMGEKPGVVIIVDGVPVMPNAGGIRLNMADVKSIKVIKGSASYLYGDGALAGALVITTKKPRAKNESELYAEVGSYSYQEYRASTYWSNEYVGVNLNASRRFSEGYWRDAELWTTSFNGKLSYFIDDTSDITLGADITEKFDEGGSRSVVGGVTAAETNPRGESNTAYTKDSGVDLDKYFLTYSKDFGNNTLLVTAYHYQDQYNQTSNPQDVDDDPQTTNVYVSHSLTDLQQQGIKGEFTMDTDLFASLIGVEFGKRDYETASETLHDYTALNARTGKEENYYDGETSKTNSKEDVIAIYGEYKHNITADWSATLNARYNTQKKEYIKYTRDYNGSEWSNNTEEDSDTFQNTAYRFGMSYNVMPNMTLFGSVATGFENPDLDDLADDPSIKEQTSINYEIGARGVQNVFGNAMTYEASVYILDNKDIIGPLDGTYAFQSPQGNIGDSRSQGFELSLKSDQEEMLSFNLAYTYLDAFYTKHNPFLVNLGSRGADYYVDVVGNELPRVSKHTVDLFLNYHVTHELKLISEIYARNSYYVDEPNTVKFAGYGLLNLQARYNRILFDNPFEFFVKVDNVFDRRYYRAAFLHADKRGAADGGYDDLITGEDASITVDPGRVYYAGISYKF